MPRILRSLSLTVTRVRKDKKEPSLSRIPMSGTGKAEGAASSSGLRHTRAVPFREDESDMPAGRYSGSGPSQPSSHPALPGSDILGGEAIRPLQRRVRVGFSPTSRTPEGFCAQYRLSSVLQHHFRQSPVRSHKWNLMLSNKTPSVVRAAPAAYNSGPNSVVMLP